MILAIGLGTSLIFCSLIGDYKLRNIVIIISLILIAQLILSLVLFYLIEIWINPFIAIFYVAFAASILKLSKNFRFKLGLKTFFRINSKTIIHIGISSILIGTLIDPNYEIALDLFYILGFFVLLIGIIPSIILSLRLKRKQS
jgi:hypothetical protein